MSLIIDGWPTLLGAKAQLNVVEGLSDVRLEITGTGKEDVLLLDLVFDGVEKSMGPHEVEVGLPGTEADSALASIGGQAYQSQDGYIDLTLDADGAISGSFQLGLAEVEDVAVGLPIAFEEGEVVRSLTGRFSGIWELSCRSRLPGHRTLVPGGDYCEALVIE